MLELFMLIPETQHPMVAIIAGLIAVLGAIRMAPDIVMEGALIVLHRFLLPRHAPATRRMII